MRILALALVAAVSLLPMPPSVAGSRPPSESCDVGVNAVPFGAYDPGSPAGRDGVGAITVDCLVAKGGSIPTWAIALDAGPYGSFAARVMTSGAHRLRYNLYTNASRTTVWGDGTAGTAKVADPAWAPVGSCSKRLPLYGRIAPLQDEPIGAYTDVITVTIEY